MLTVESWKRMLSTEDYQLPKHLAIRLKERSNAIVVSEHSNFNTTKDYMHFLVEA